MAVTKIRKISSWTLLVAAFISVVVFGLFFFGGLGEPIGEWKNPLYTGEMLIWSYILLALCVAGIVIFGIFQYGSTFKTNPKGALAGLGVLVVFAVLLVIAYSMGDGTPIPGINADSQKYNVPVWLKITDTWLYSMYILLGLALLAMLWGAVKKVLNK